MDKDMISFCGYMFSIYTHTYIYYMHWPIIIVLWHMDIPVCKPRFGARLSRCLFVHLMLALILGDKTMRSFETTDVPAACHGDVIHIYIYKKQYQKCSVYHSLSKVSHIKVFPMLLLKKSLYGFGHVFSVRTPHDRPRTQFDHSSCLRFFYLWYPMRFGVHKKATSISTCLSCLNCWHSKSANP